MNTLYYMLLKRFDIGYKTVLACRRIADMEETEAYKTKSSSFNREIDE